ncbi:MAG: hypothetical protein FWD71_02285 [Oscillospiraceae bacterium]|nr:hypothetical protein [Oscillospiraceae bacterium]
MMKKFNTILYRDNIAVAMHFLLGIFLSGIFIIIIYFTKIIPLDQFKEFINTEIISLSATIAGFELAGVTLLISLSGNKKLQYIRDIGSDKTIYKLFYYSILFFILSILLMIIDINLFKTIANNYIIIKDIIEYISVFLIGQGFLYFLSSIRILMLIFK